METSVTISDYHELLTLHRALMLIKFSRNPIDITVVASPFIAKTSNRIVETLAVLEAERGGPSAANKWLLTITPNSEVWEVTINNALVAIGDHWLSWEKQKQQDVASDFLSPFVRTDDLINKFINQLTAMIIEEK